MKRNFAIYAAEAPAYVSRHLGSEIDHYHAYLMLVDETQSILEEKDGGIRQGEELHFINNVRGKLGAYVRQKAHTYDGHIILTGCMGGHEETVFPVWNRFMLAALELQDRKLEFEPSKFRGAVNCRAGLRAALESADLAFNRSENIRMNPSSCAELYNRIAGSMPPLRLHVPLEESRQMKEALTKALPFVR